MMAAAAAAGQAVSSTTTGGLPGPAAITRLPVCMAAFTTAGPPVTHRSATPGWWKSASADAMLGSATVVIALATPVSRSISRFNIWRAWAATFQAAGCGLKTAALPAAITLMALLAIVGRRVGGGEHHAHDAPRSPLDDAQARRVAARLDAQRLDAEHLLHDPQLLDLVVEAADARLLELAPAELRGVLVAEPADDRDRPPALLEAHRLRCAAAPPRQPRRPRRRWRRRRARAPPAGERPPASPVPPAWRRRSTTCRAISATSSSRPDVVSSASVLTAWRPPSRRPRPCRRCRRSPRRSAARASTGVRRAELPCVKSTHSPSPAPRTSTATIELPEATSASSFVMWGWISSSLLPDELRVLLRRDDAADHLGQEHRSRLTGAAPP